MIIDNGSNNRIDTNITLNEQMRITFNGNNNSLLIGAKCTIVNTNILFQGDNHKVVIGKGVCLYSGDIVFEDHDNLIEIGDKTVIHKDFSLDICEPNRKIIIGKDCLLSWGTRMRTTDSHSIIDISTNKRINYGDNIFIGNHVWICELVTILKGVSVSDNCIIGTKSVLTRGNEYEANSIIAGNPAKVVKRNVTWEEFRREDI